MKPNIVMNSKKDGLFVTNLVYHIKFPYFYFLNNN